MVGGDGSPKAPAPLPRRPAKDQSEINRIHRLSPALIKQSPPPAQDHTSHSHADTHDMSTGKTAR